MCLSRVDTKLVNGTMRGFKRLRTYNGKLSHLGPDGKLLTSNKWLQSGRGNLNQGKIESLVYPNGFHIFLCKEDADNYSYSGTTYEVLFKDIVAIGKQSIRDDGPTIIARQMKILRKVESKLPF